MKVTTRPNQCFQTNGITWSGAGPAQDLADDNPATWVTFHHDDHPFFGFVEPTVGTGPNQIPPGAVVKEGVLWATARKSATSGNPLVINWHMYDPGGGGAGPSQGTNVFGSRDDVPVPNSTSTYNLLLDQRRGNPHVRPTNILVDGYSHGQSDSPTVLFFELGFDTIVVPLPVATITAPTGTVTGDTTPAVSWTNTLDSDGGPQKYFEVKLSTLGGFDPDTDTGTHQSGIKDGGALSWEPVNSMAEGNWTAYVRVAQVVNGEQHWSAWDTQAFIISIARPGVPSMTLTSEPASGRIKILNVTNAAAATTSLYQTQFSDDGTTWEYVRTSLGDGRSTPSGGAATIYDYEASMGATRSYRTRALHAYPEGYATSAWSSTQTSSWTSTSWWVKPTETPSLSMAVTVRSHPSTTRAGRVGLFPPLNAKYPIAVQDKRSSAAGQIVFRFATDVERDAFEALCDDSSVVLIQAPAGTIDWPDRYCALGDYERERVIDNSGSLFPYSFDSVQWTEVARP